MEIHFKLNGFQLHLYHFRKKNKKISKYKYNLIDKIFYSKLKGINNPWNNNRPVKVSRDGTEVETNVGERLIQEFGVDTSNLNVNNNNNDEKT